MQHLQALLLPASVVGTAHHEAKRCRHCVGETGIVCGRYPPQGLAPPIRVIFFRYIQIAAKKLSGQIDIPGIKPGINPVKQESFAFMTILSAEGCFGEGNIPFKFLEVAWSAEAAVLR